MSRHRRGCLQIYPIDNDFVDILRAFREPHFKEGVNACDDTTTDFFSGGWNVAGIRFSYLRQFYLEPDFSVIGSEKDEYRYSATDFIYSNENSGSANNLLTQNKFLLQPLK
jgi:hypothetical protein